jgi:hypothetical protein
MDCVATHRSLRLGRELAGNFRLRPEPSLTAGFQCGRAAFESDQEWLHVRDESEKDGPIVVSIRNQILSPTSFSALT